MDIKTTSVYEANAEAWLDKAKSKAWNEGGTSSSKTYSILQLIILILMHAKSEMMASVVSESLPHLKRGCIRDFQAIMGDDFDDAKYNKTDHIYSFGKGTLEFFPADDPSKMRGGRRDILFINEANNIPYESYRELEIRTRVFTFLDWNPVSEFWAHENNLMRKPNSTYIHSTYRDALHVLPKQVVANIESNKNLDPNWWNVYGLGLVGSIEGLVYPYFSQVNDLPNQGDHRYGLDFGYSGDPAVLTDNAIFEEAKEVYSRELFYQVGLTNHDIAKMMEEKGVIKHVDLIIADSAEPKSIKEISDYGFNIVACQKGPDSVEFGHQKLRQYKQFWTKDSLDCIKEQKNFMYLPDKTGKLTEKTTHRFSHGMDSRRYGVVGSVKGTPFMVG